MVFDCMYLISFYTHWIYCVPFERCFFRVLLLLLARTILRFYLLRSNCTHSRRRFVLYVSSFSFAIVKQMCPGDVIIIEKINRFINTTADHVNKMAKVDDESLFKFTRFEYLRLFFVSKTFFGRISIRAKKIFFSFFHSFYLLKCQSWLEIDPN